MKFRNLVGLLMLLLGSVGLVAVCFGTTDTIRIAGPLNISLFNDFGSVGIGFGILGLMIWSAVRLLNHWAATTGMICLTTGSVLLIVMLVRLGNLSEDVLQASGGRYVPASPDIYSACVLPAAVLLAAGYWKLVHHKTTKGSARNHNRRL